MASDKKIDLRLSPELAKAAKLKAAQSDQTVQDWILGLVTRELQSPKLESLEILDFHPTDLGRIDNRIDHRIEQRAAALEQRIEALTAKLQHIQTDLSDSQPDRHSRAA